MRLRPGQAAGKTLVRAEGVEPTQPCGQRIFLPLRFSPPSTKSALRRSVKLWGLDYPFTVPRRLGVRCCPSSLYTFLREEAWLGTAVEQVSSNLSSSASPVSRRALKSCLSPPRLPFRH